MAPRRTPENSAPPDAVLRVQKYPNRRLYDRTTSRHLTLEELYELVAGGRRVEVTDSRSGADITNVVLAQLLLEHDPTRLGAVPAELLHLLIRSNRQLLPFIEQGLLAATAQAAVAWQAWQDRLASLARGRPPALDWFMPASPAGSPPAETDRRLLELEAELAALRTTLAARDASRTSTPARSPTGTGAGKAARTGRSSKAASRRDRPDAGPPDRRGAPMDRKRRRR